MKRDMDYVREILLRIEEAEDEFTSGDLLSDAPTPKEEDKLDEHLTLLADDARLIEGTAFEHMDGTAWAGLRLTWAGHEYLETIRDPEIWAKTKEGAAKIGDFSLDLLKALAKGYVKEKAKRMTGLDLDL